MYSPRHEGVLLFDSQISANDVPNRGAQNNLEYYQICHQKVQSYLQTEMVSDLHIALQNPQLQMKPPCWKKKKHKSNLYDLEPKITIKQIRLLYSENFYVVALLQFVFLFDLWESILLNCYAACGTNMILFDTGLNY